MANGRVTIASVNTKVEVLENTMTLRFNAMSEDINELKDTIQPMALGWVEVARKVKNHHEVFHDHSKIINDLKAAGYPGRKVMPPVDGEELSRRSTDLPKYRYARYALYVSIVGLIISNIGSCAYVMSTIGKIMEQVPH